jgi:hypothetical protein
VEGGRAERVQDRRRKCNGSPHLRTCHLVPSTKGRRCTEVRLSDAVRWEWSRQVGLQTREDTRRLVRRARREVRSSGAPSQVHDSRAVAADLHSRQPSAPMGMHTTTTTTTTTTSAGAGAGAGAATTVLGRIAEHLATPHVEGALHTVTATDSVSERAG